MNARYETEIGTGFHLYREVTDKEGNRLRNVSNTTPVQWTIFYMD